MRFGGIVVADAIDFQLKPGEVVGLIGPNGAGKTTLFNLLTGFITPHSGQITLGGQRIERLPSYRRARLGIARTWQSPRLFSSLSILDNLLISDRSYPGESLFENIFRARKVTAAERSRTCAGHQTAPSNWIGAPRQCFVASALIRATKTCWSCSCAHERRAMPFA